jgi:ribonuclease HII
MKWLVGIDEAGRGPLAGPVAVGVAKISKDFDWKLIEGVGDSKQISAKKRELIFNRAQELKKQNKLDFAVSMVSAKVIDDIGITGAISLAISRSISRLKLSPKDCYIKLDGSLKAPIEFSQETIIKGDSKERVIGLASILAKETRDAYMMGKSSEVIFAAYGFAAHKGYGTKSHRQAIKENGLSSEHRKSYCKNAMMW